MVRPNLATLPFVVTAAIMSIACSGESPIGPVTTSDGLQAVTVLSQGVAGSYGLSFSLNSGGELILTAHVQALVSGAPAQGGAVTFQYCSFPGRPNDITQPDEAPSSACADGSASWAHLARVLVNPATGDASLDFGLVRVVNTIGFRGHYTSQNSGIASGDIEPVDWVR